MDSEYLTEDKICQMFREDPDSGHKKQQISLNFTVTSRQSRCMPQPGIQISKSSPKYDNNTNMNHHSTSNKHNHTLSTSNNSITLAMNELDKFNNWMYTLNKNSEKLVEDFSMLTTYAENNRSVLLSMPDLGALRKRYSKSVKNANDKNNYPCQIPRDCLQCKKKSELIHYIEEQYNFKAEQCKKLEKCQQELKQQIQRGLRNTFLDAVEFNLLKQENQNLNSQIISLKMQLDKSKLQKSSHMQKSTTFLKTKQLLEKRLESGCTNSKLFSNAKYSTNTLNPNDTMNRVQSIICFGDTQPNLDQLIRFYGQQANAMKARMKEIVAEEEKKRNMKFTRETRSLYLNQTNQNKLLNLYSIIQNKLIQVKNYKEKNPILFNGSTKQLKQRKSEQSFMVNSRVVQQNEELKKIITTLEKQIRGLQNQKTNLMQTNHDILLQYTKIEKRMKQLEQKIFRMRIQYKNMYESEKTQSLQRKKLQFDIEQMKGSIRVYCRVRPRMGAELKHKSAIVYAEDVKIIKEGKEYEFDYVFGERSSQQNVYNEVKPLVEYAYNQKNLCIFTYGQTGSGKTYTMHGDEHNPGLTLNIINDLYEMIHKDKITCRSHEVSLSMSIVEIYKEEIRDLLGVGGKLEIKQIVGEGVHLQGCKPIRFQNKQQMLQVYQNGIRNRTSCQTEMNTDSSRSHFIVTIFIEKVEKISKKSKEQGMRSITVTKISLIDLAGAEKLTTSNPLIAKEAQFINKSLSSLMSVLSALRNKSQHVPYRDSKLTYLLKQFLSSKCNILTFVNISSSELNSSQTTNSLMFGVRVRAIQRNTYSKSKDAKENKENEKNRRSSARLSIS